GLCGRWRLGALTGLSARIGPMVMFGYVYGSTGIITVFLPIGKALTGLSVGLISQAIGSIRKPRAPIVIATVLIGFVPEAVLTWFYFVNLVPIFVSGSFSGPTAATLVLVQAWAEMIIISFLTIALIGNAGFKTFLGRLASASQ